MTNHLECVTDTKNRWYWYLLVIVITIMASNTIGSIPLIFLIIIDIIQNKKSSLDIEALSQGNFLSSDIDSNVLLACMLFSFIVFLATLILFVKLFHKRSWTELINGTKRIRLSRFFIGFVLWGAILIVSFIIGYLTEPDNFEFRFEPTKFIPLLLISLIMIPFQASSEEILFRGYLAQGVASWTGSRLWALLIPSVLFGLLHSANPEIAEYGFGVMMFNYITIGLIFGMVSLLDDGIELAMGAHSINNILGSILLTYDGSVLQTEALFKAKVINPSEDLISGVIAGVLFIGILFFICEWDFGILKQRVPSPSTINP